MTTEAPLEMTLNVLPLATDPSPVVMNVRLVRTSPGAEQLRFDMDIDVTLTEASRPRDAGGDLDIAEQVVGWRVEVAGIELARRNLVDAINVTRSIDEGVTFILRVPFRSDEDVIGELDPATAVQLLFGNLISTPGPPTGLDSVTISGLYVTSTGLHVFPLVTNGLIHAATQNRTPQGSNFLELVGIGPSARYDRRHVDYKLPAGHNLRRDKVVAQVMAKVGSPIGSLWSGTRMLKEIQWIDAPAIDLAREIADADGYSLEWDRAGQLSAYKQVRSSAPVLSFEPRDLIRSRDVRASGTNDTPTRIRISSVRQVEKEGGDGQVTTISEAKGFSEYAVKGSLFQHSGIGNISADDATAAPKFQLTSKVITTVVRDGGTVVARETERFGWYARESARYTTFSTVSGRNITTGVYNTYFSGYIYDEGAVKDDQLKLLTDRQERFRPVNRQLVTREFDARGFLVGEETTERTWYPPKESFKSRSLNNPPDWSTVNYGTLESLSGPGEVWDSFGGSVLAEKFILTSRVAHRWDVDDDGFVTGETISEFKHHARPGTTELYRGAYESRDAREQIRLVREESITYRSVGDQLETISTVEGIDGARESVDVDTRDGFLPPAEKKDAVLPVKSDFEDPADFDLAVAASVRENQRINCEVISAGLEGNRPQSDLEEEFPWGESLEDICNRATTILQLDSAVLIEADLAANFVVREGEVVHLRLPDIGLNHDVHVTSVEHGQAFGAGPLLTTIRGRVYALET